MARFCWSECRSYCQYNCYVLGFHLFFCLFYVFFLFECEMCVGEGTKDTGKGTRRSEKRLEMKTKFILAIIRHWNASTSMTVRCANGLNCIESMWSQLTDLHTHPHVHTCVNSAANATHKAATYDILGMTNTAGIVLSSVRHTIVKSRD